MARETTKKAAAAEKFAETCSEDRLIHREAGQPVKQIQGLSANAP